jgi:integrase
LNVGAIDGPTVIKFLTPIWKQTPETGSRLRGRIEKILDWAVVHQFRQGPNPAAWGGNLEHVFSAKRNNGESGHHKAMPVSELPPFMARLREKESASAKALEVLILTAARTSEVLGMTWGEIDFDKKLWTVPAARMKAGVEHVVPFV